MGTLCLCVAILLIDNGHYFVGGYMALLGVLKMVISFLEQCK